LCVLLWPVGSLFSKIERTTELAHESPEAT